MLKQKPTAITLFKLQKIKTKRTIMQACFLQKKKNLLHHLHADSRLLEHSKIDKFNCNKRAGWLIEKRRIDQDQDHLAGPLLHQKNWLYVSELNLDSNIITITTLKRKAPCNSDRAQMSLQWVYENFCHPFSSVTSFDNMESIAYKEGY